MKKIFLTTCTLFVATVLLSQKTTGKNDPFFHRKFPYHDILILKNNSHDKRMVTFTTAAGSIRNMMQGRTKLENNLVLQFSPRYKLDSGFIRKNIINLSNALPKDFWDFSVWGKFYDNEPNQEAIWFTYIFVQVDKAGYIKVFSAYKVTFEGNDATIDEQRADPKVINLEFISDKKSLGSLEKKLNSLKPVNL